MEAYPLSIPRRTIALYRSGESTEGIAERFGYCVAGVCRVRQRFEETGSLERRKTKPGRKPTLDAAAPGRLAARVASARTRRWRNCGRTSASGPTWPSTAGR